ncbi:unnamed protein product [Meganyctiphanes norvegica]|uniref:Uncharacterized protein n=1 Tax=Meganyctiphanes norvegica TaxID=48144 RepID=A0AAV2QBH9_MEGNR
MIVFGVCLLHEPVTMYKRWGYAYCIIRVLYVSTWFLFMTYSIYRLCARGLCFFHNPVTMCERWDCAYCIFRVFMGITWVVFLDILQVPTICTWFMPFAESSDHV